MTTEVVSAAPVAASSAPTSSLPATWTVLDVVRWTTARFAERGVGTPRLDAELLVAHVLSLPRLQLYVQFERVLSPDELRQERAYYSYTAEGVDAQVREGDGLARALLVKAVSAVSTVVLSVGKGKGGPASHTDFRVSPLWRLNSSLVEF